MACGCNQACGCIVIGDSVTTTAVTVGNTTTVSAIQTFLGVADTSCVNMTLAAGIVSANLTLLSSNSIALACVPGGLQATLNIDPASTAPVSITAAGLRVDCCTETFRTVSDTNSVDLTLAAGNLSATVRIDPASTAPVIVGAAGIKIDCCAASPPAISDTTTVDLSTPAGILNAVVIPNTLAGMENQAGGVSIKLENDPAAVAPDGTNLLRFTTAGDLTLQEDIVAQEVGIDTRSITAGTAVSLAATVAAGFGTTSLTVVITNTDIVPLTVRMYGIGTFIVAADGGFASTGTAGTDRQFGQNMILDISAVAGGGVDVGSAGLATFFQGGHVASTPTMTWRSHLEKWAFLPVGGSVTFRSRSQCIRDTAGWFSTTPNGTSYQFSNILLQSWPDKLGGWSV